MRKITLNYYQDPGHGWVKIPIKTLVRLKIAHKISNCSYMRDKYAYLEEDCDLSTLYAAADKAGIKINLKDYHTNKQSKIRSYKYYFFEQLPADCFMEYLKDNDKIQFVTVKG